METRDSELSTKVDGWIDGAVWFFYLKVYDQILSRLIPRQEMLQEVLNKVNIHKGYKYLDAGCGSGYFSFLMQSNGGMITGIDNSHALLERAKKIYPAVNFIYGDLEKRLIFFKNEEFDGIISINNLYLIRSFGQLNSHKIPFPLLEFTRLLKAGGVLIIATPRYPGFSMGLIFNDHLKKSFAKYGIFRTLLEFIVYFPQIMIVVLANLYIKKKGKIGYYYFYKEKEMKDYLEMCGFKDIEIGTCYSNQNIMVVAKKYAKKY